MTTDRKSAVTTNRDFSAPNPIADRSRIQLPTNFHLRSSTSPDGLLGLDSRTTGNQEGLDKIRGGNANGKADNHGADSSDGANGKSPSLTPSAPGGSKLSLVPTDPRSGTGASMSKFNYQNLRDRGRSMSDRVASDASGGPTETPDVNTLRRSQRSGWHIGSRWHAKSNRLRSKQLRRFPLADLQFWIRRSAFGRGKLRLSHDASQNVALRHSA